MTSLQVLQIDCWITESVLHPQKALSSLSLLWHSLERKQRRCHPSQPDAQDKQKAGVSAGTCSPLTDTSSPRVGATIFNGELVDRITSSKTDKLGIV